MIKKHLPHFFLAALLTASLSLIACNLIMILQLN